MMQLNKLFLSPSRDTGTCALTDECINQKTNEEKHDLIHSTE